MNNIEKEIDDLFNELESSDLYKNYKNVKKQLEENTELNKILTEVKRLQKIAVNEKDKQVELELKKLYEELDNYPLYQSYLSIKEELEEQLQHISFTLNDYFKSILEL